MISDQEKATRLVTAAAMHYQYPTGMLLGRSRTKGVSRARKVLMSAIRETTDLSFADIADVLERSHEAAHYAHKTCSADPAMVAERTYLITLALEEGP